MANIFTEQENAGHCATGLKMRQRLHSEPEKLKTPSTGRAFFTPHQSGRKALALVNNMANTPTVNVQEKKLLKPEVGPKVKPQKKVQEYPEIEKFFPYDPLEFEKSSVPEDLVPLSKFALSGLAFPRSSHLHVEEPEILHPLPRISPMTMPKPSDHCSDFDAFLQTLDELTELPPEPVTD